MSDGREFPANACTTLHATCVGYRGMGMLIRGRAGAGKSGLALKLMALGAGLISDDRTIVTRDQNRIIASCPEAIFGRIEARGIGILGADPHPPVPVACVVDLDHVEKDRLPLHRETQVMGQSVPLLYKVEADHFAPALLQYLAFGRKA